MTASPVTVERIGRAAEPVVVIDDFAPDPDGLRAAAAAADYGPGAHHYPGVRAALPDGYMRGLRPLIAGPLAEAFGQPGEVDVIDASYSIVTTPPAELSVTQRLPHCDAYRRERIALVHYLSPGSGDGTAFFRHRSTGFETIDQHRAPIYFDQLDAELRHGGVPPPAYVADDTPLFERTFVVPSRFNRAVLYRSWLLHSGAIGRDAALSADPAIGRLTVTAFLSVR